jgi:hypothetical protein
MIRRLAVLVALGLLPLLVSAGTCDATPTQGVVVAKYVDKKRLNPATAHGHVIWRDQYGARHDVRVREPRYSLCAIGESWPSCVDPKSLPRRQDPA